MNSLTPWERRARVTQNRNICLQAISKRDDSQHALAFLQPMPNISLNITECLATNEHYLRDLHITEDPEKQHYKDPKRTYALFTATHLRLFRLNSRDLFIASAFIMKLLPCSLSNKIFEDGKMKIFLFFLMRRNTLGVTHLSCQSASLLSVCLSVSCLSVNQRDEQLCNQGRSSLFAFLCVIISFSFFFSYFLSLVDIYVR